LSLCQLAFGHKSPLSTQERGFALKDHSPNYKHALEYLQTCLEGLGEHLRRFITWRYTEAIPLEEIAVRSGRSVAAVKKQLWKLRRKLHECVEARMTAEGEPS